MHGNTLKNSAKSKVLNKEHVCIDCGTDISHLHPNAKRCNICTAKKSRKFEDMVKYIPGFLDDKEEGIHYVKCAICGYISRSLQGHLIYTHGIKPKEYEKQYNAKFMCEEEAKIRSDKFKGKNNPAYNHGGKLSPWSYKNQSKIKEEIDACKEKTINAVKESTNLNTKLEYWIEQTNGDIDRAKELLRQRQQTFSLEKCTEKYGDEEGYKVWKERQEKWQNTLKSKSDEEIAEINKKKIYKNGMISKSEQDLFSNLFESFSELEQQVFIKHNSLQYYAYDIVLDNKIIEYNGDYWHANPIKYSKDDSIKYPNNKIKTAKEIWEHDEEKLNFAKSLGYDVLVIWESEYKNNKEETLEKCKMFLMN